MKNFAPLLILLLFPLLVSAEEAKLLGPEMLKITPDGKTFAVTCRLEKSLRLLDVATKKTRHTVALPSPPSGVVISPDGKTAYVTCEAPQSKVCCVDIATGEITAKLTAGHYATAPVVSPDGKTLYVCNRFNNDVSVLDLATKKELRRVKVPREPVAAAVTPDGKTLVVCNFQSTDRSDSLAVVQDGKAHVVRKFQSRYNNNLYDVATEVSLIDTTTWKVKNIRLLDGTTSLRGVCISPDGKYAYTTHWLARYQMPTTSLERNGIYSNAFAIIDLENKEFYNTIMLDDVDLGAGNPWGIACSDDGKWLIIAHAGTHELSLIDRKGVHKKLDSLPHKSKDKPIDIRTAYFERVPDNLSILVGLRERHRLAGNGPRSVALHGGKVHVVEHFSETLATLPLEAKVKTIETVRLCKTLNNDHSNMPEARRGEMLFNDAELCFQKWMSCATCHPDGRAQALNWDLLNDGLGNPKNIKSMLHCVETPPSNITGVRKTARKTIEMSIKGIQFTVRDDAIDPIEQYCKELKAVPSPYLTPEGKLTKLAQEGKRVFEKAKCGRCHVPEKYFQDGKLHDVKSRGDLAKQGMFNTPTLHEVWRSAPYGHDGHYLTIQEWLGDPLPLDKMQFQGGQLTTTNPDPRGRHGQKGKNGHITLSNKEIEALAEYVLSL